MNDYERIRDAILEMRLDTDPCYQVENETLNQKMEGYESIKVRINGQLYFLFDYYHKGLRGHIVFEKEDMPIYLGNVQNGRFVQLHHDNHAIIDNRNKYNINEIINVVFGDLASALEKRYIVVNAIKDVFGIEIPIEHLGFDLCDKKYYINDWKIEDGVESRLIKNFFEKRKDKLLLDKKSYDGYCSFYKYTSLNTLLKMLQSQKIRMYSLPAMNDRKEVGFLTSNEKCIRDSEEDWNFHSVMREADKRFITSFSILEDDLNMWRLYGDDAKGVCLEFKAKYETPNLYPVNYERKDNKDIQHYLARIEEELKKSNLELKFLSLERKWQYYMKPACFDYEKEVRLLIENDRPKKWDLLSNGIITPYIECNLFDRVKGAESFPLTLTKVILGPNMKEQARNKHQIELMVKNLLFPVFLYVEPSKLDCYI